MFKKAFWVPYEDSANYPTLAKTMEAISKYCEENGKSYTFINDDEVEINGNCSRKVPCMDSTKNTHCHVLHGVMRMNLMTLVIDKKNSKI